jgi:hypothetical protein
MERGGGDAMEEVAKMLAATTVCVGELRWAVLRLADELDRLR